MGDGKEGALSLLSLFKECHLSHLCSHVIQHRSNAKNKLLLFSGSVNQRYIEKLSHLLQVYKTNKGKGNPSKDTLYSSPCRGDNCKERSEQEDPQYCRQQRSTDLVREIVQNKERSIFCTRDRDTPEAIQELHLYQEVNFH